MVEGEPTDAESYDFGFRSYLPDTATFGSLDDVAGSAADVRSLNRFVYAIGRSVSVALSPVAITRLGRHCRDRPALVSDLSAIGKPGS